MAQYRTWFAIEAADAASVTPAALHPTLGRQAQRGHSQMRQILIVAAIAAGLIAIWAALLPLAG